MTHNYILFAFTIHKQLRYGKSLSIPEIGVYDIVQAESIDDRHEVRRVQKAQILGGASEYSIKTIAGLAFHEIDI